MTLNLDIVAGLVVGWLALCLFTLQVFSSPKRAQWITLPTYVRHGLVATGATFMVWSVNLVSLAPQGAAVLGHMNALGVVAILTLAYTLTALVVWVVRQRLPDRGWLKLSWVATLMRRNPEAVPVAMTAEDAERKADIARALDPMANVNGAFVSPPDPDSQGAVRAAAFIARPAGLAESPRP